MRDELTIYTDGSHFKGNGSGRLGIGGVIVKGNKILNKFSNEITKQFLEFYYGTSDCSNPTMEMLAVLQALQRFKKEIKGNDIILKADYQGVKEWMDGTWKIKKPYISRIKNDIDSEIYKQDLKGRIKFEWVPSHQKGNTDDIKYNNLVDLLAKGEMK